MTDIKQDGLTPDPTKVDNGENSTPKTEEKQFTQAEVNQIVAGRLSKEREKFADYDALKTKAGELEQVKNQLNEITSKASQYDEALNDVYNNLVSELDEDKKGLIPDNYSLVDKIKYVHKNKNVFTSKPVVQTPPPETKTKGEPGLYGGKYLTLQEFANKDPQGYLKYRKSN